MLRRSSGLRLLLFAATLASLSLYAIVIDHFLVSTLVLISVLLACALVLRSLATRKLLEEYLMQRRRLATDLVMLSRRLGPISIGVPGIIA